jgi:putative ABC transport system permease protein
MLQDIRQALRVLAKRPSSAIVTVIVFALAIGANTTVFSVFNAFFLRPLAFPDDRLVMIYESLPGAGVDDVGVTINAYVAMRGQVSALEEVAIFARGDRRLPGELTDEPISVPRVSPSLLTMLGVAPALGRGFTEDEVVPGNERVILLSHELWVTHFGARMDIVGQDVRLDDGPFRVVGVMPEGFGFPDDDVAAWVPFAYTFSESGEPNELDDSGYSEGIGRLKAGATIAGLSGELDAFGRSNAERWIGPGLMEAARYTIRAEPLRDYINGDLRQRLLVLQGLVLAVLLIACANVANLQLAQLTVRRKELAVRATLGASARRLARLVALESVLLALAGAAGGLVLARGGLELVRALGLASADDGLELDAVVLVVTLVAALLAALTSALLPLGVLLREDLARGLQESGRGNTGGVAMRRWRSGLVVVQLAAGVALLAGAGLLTKSFYELLREGPGFQPAGVWSAAVEFPDAPRYVDDADRARFFEQALVELRSLPGVVDVGFTTMLPFVGSDWFATVNVDGHERLDGGVAKAAQLHSIDDGYFTTMGIPVIRGRNFAASETDRVAIVDERFAGAYWPDGNALGERLRVGGPANDWYTIVGVVPAVKHNSFTGDEYEQTVYWHLLQRPPPEHTGMFVLRTLLPVAGLTPAAAAAIARVDPLVALVNVQPMEARVLDALGPQRAPMVLTLVFAAIAVALAVIGVYSVLAWAVAQRVGEIGLRMALGARASDVLRMIMQQGARMILVGLVLGTAGALALGRVLASQIPEVVTADPLVLGVAVCVLAAAALVASWLPARRAARVDPLQALRQD